MLLKDEFLKFLRNKKYMFFLIITVLFGFGYYFTYDSIVIDDTAMGRYYTEGRILRQGRWGAFVLTNLLNLTEYNPFINKLGMVFCLITASILFCCIFKSASKNQLHSNSYIVFSCLFISYPLINEIMYFVASQWTISFTYVLVAITVWLLQKSDSNSKIKKYLLAISLLAFSISFYEISVSIYIVLIVAFMTLQYLYNDNMNSSIVRYVKQGVPYVGTLLVSIILESVISRVFIWIYHEQGVFRESLWLNQNLVITLKDLIKGIILNYILKGIAYMPILEFAIASCLVGIICVILCIRRKWAGALLAVLLWFASISLALAQGETAVSRAMQQSFAIFIAFTFMLLFQKMITSHKLIKNVGVILFSFIIIYQVTDLNKWSYVNFMRYEEELNVVKQIGYEIEKNYEVDKPVVFVGRRQLSHNIKQYTHMKYGSKDYKVLKLILTKLPFSITLPERYLDEYGYQYVESNGTSVINWGVYAFQDANSELLKFFAKNGYVFEQSTEEMFREGMREAVKMPSWPKEGSIIENENYILVKLGKW